MAPSLKATFASCIVLLLALSTLVSVEAQTTYTVPGQLRWRSNPSAPGSYYAEIRGTRKDGCGQLVRLRFPNGFVYPWHVNQRYAIYTVLSGTLVIGFDRHHSRSAERVLPAGSVVQGLALEPHYGRTIGETLLDLYVPCKP